jgi:hypothetical protein
MERYQRRFKEEDDEKELDEDKLTYSQKQALPDSAFVFPKERKYPIPDLAHARNALARVAANGTSEEQARVRAAVHKKFPSIESEK